MCRTTSSVCMFVHVKIALKWTHLPHQFSVNFGHPIDGSRSLDTEVRRRVTRRRGTKCSNGARDKEAQAVLQSQVQHIMKA